MTRKEAETMADIMAEVFASQLETLHGLLKEVQDCPPFVLMAMVGSLIDGYADHNGMTAEQTEGLIEDLLETSKRAHAVSGKGEN